MIKTAHWWGLLGGLAVVVILGLAWQRLQMRPLQAELEYQRDRHREIDQLRAEHAKLAAAQVPEAELERLRSDRAIIPLLRREVAELRTKAESKSQALKAAAPPPERFGMGVEMRASEWRNAGGATAAAALETVLWAAAGGEVEAFAKRIRFDAAARTAALELLRSLPPTEQAKHSSPEALMAYLTIKDVPIGAALVTTWTGRTESLQSATVRLTAPGEKPKQVYLVFVREGEEWKLRATDTAVAKYAAALRGAPQKAAGAK